MNQQTMTVHEALCEVKVSDSKIRSVLSKVKFCAPNKSSNTKLGGKDVSEFKEVAKSDLQKVMDIIRRTEAIKAALNKSNAATMIKVGDKEMSVAEAIYMMAHGTDAKQQLLAVLKSQYKSALETVQYENGNKLDERLDRMIEANYGSKDKAEPELIKTATELFLQQNQYELIDPIDIKKVINDLEDEITEFRVNVDSALQISNATTYITIEW